MSAEGKFYLECSECGRTIAGFPDWFRSGQRCPACGSGRAEVRYHQPLSSLRERISRSAGDTAGLWHYFDFLPVNDRENIVSAGEGIVPIDRWEFLERFARERFGLNVKVHAHRQDDNYATGTFKDLSGSVVASVLKESGIGDYVVASTGNIAVSYARYLNAAGVSLYAFIPENSSTAQEAEISCFGQRVFRVKGDYSRAKELAHAFAEAHGMVLAAGNFDPRSAYPWPRANTNTNTDTNHGHGHASGIETGTASASAFFLHAGLPLWRPVLRSACTSYR